MLTAKLNGTDVGNLNHSEKFAKSLDQAIYETMKDDLKCALESILPSTNHKRPLGMVMDKMTPSKSTGQIHAIILPVPENSLSQPLLVPLMLDVPTVTEYDVSGLAKMAKKILNDAGAEDNQLEGLGWDGEYVKKGVKSKFIEILNIENWDSDQKNSWITSVWEPAHELELGVIDLRKEDIFEWFNKDVGLINEAIGMLNIGKGLQMSIEASERLGIQHFKLKTMSDTRFVAYWGGCLSSFEKDLQFSIEVLKIKAETDSKSETREKAKRVMRRLQTQEFMLLNLGMIDIYQKLGIASKALQKVEQFPWEILETQQRLIKDFEERSNIQLIDEHGASTVQNIDKKIWPALRQNAEKVLSCKYKGLNTTIFSMLRRGRSSEEINVGSLNLQITVQNKLSSFCKTLAKKFRSRIQENQYHESAKMFQLMSTCLDVSALIKCENDQSLENKSKESLVKLLRLAQYDETSITQILDEYRSFKSYL